MEARHRLAVRARAANACEYCQRRQGASPIYRMQIEHITPRKHGGGDELDNLALACSECNLKKSSDLAGLDPESGLLIRLYHPRRDQWDDHFAWDGLRIVGTTPI